MNQSEWIVMVSELNNYANSINQDSSDCSPRLAEKANNGKAGDPKSKAKEIRQRLFGKERRRLFANDGPDGQNKAVSPVSLTPLRILADISSKILDGYGSFFALSHPCSKLLIFICAMLQPHSGICGVAGALFVICWRQVLNFQSESERIEIINGMLFGMLIGSLFTIKLPSLCLIVFGTLAIVLVSAIFTDTIGKKMNLPLLGLPYAFVAYVVIPFAASLHLIPAAAHLPGLWRGLDVLLPLGAMYFNGTGIGGTLVLAAFCLSSRYLALLAIASSAVASLFLSLLSIPSDSILSLVARMNSVLASCIIGGLFAVPGKKSFLVSLVASIMTSAVTLALSNVLSPFGLPALALPFVLVTYLCMLSLNSQRGPAWTYFWLAAPALPEKSMEQIQIAEIRGLDYRSVALKLPLRGAWQIYQGFGGKHTHNGDWYHALDFFQTRSGTSFINDGSKLSDYHCFAKPVLSPAFGTVVDFSSKLGDNAPGEVDTINNWGNYVLLHLDCGSYVVLAHLRQHSINLNVGARVSPGDYLGSIGNSGRSPQPHLHMHVQNSSVLGAKTIPFHLTGVIIHCNSEATFSLRACPGEKDLVSSPIKSKALGRALRLAVGNRFVFRVEQENGGQSLGRLQVSLDINGQFWLENESGAQVAFSQNDELLVFYNRQGPADLLLDAFVLSFGSTPLVEGSISWQDVLPGRLFALGCFKRLIHVILYPFGACVRSKYRRCFDSLLRVWTQTAEHRLGHFECSTFAQVCEDKGLRAFILRVGDKTVLKADLLELGIREDNGIPGWHSSPAKVSNNRITSISKATEMGEPENLIHGNENI